MTARCRLLCSVCLLLGSLSAYAAAPITHTRAEVEAMIEEAGKTPPAWWDSTPLKVPQGLDLTWETQGPWNPQKHIGQYLWDIVYPNPGRWREGARLIHHVLTVNKDNPQRLTRTMTALAFIYCDLLQDYPRAAFWARKARRDDLRLAKCYWHMGSKDMAVEVIQGMEDDTGNGGVIRLWAEMGELPTALKIAEDTASDGYPDTAYLAAGTACCLAGREVEGLRLLAKVAAMVPGPKDGRMKRNRERAIAMMEGVKLAASLDLSRIPDGEYRATCTAYAGPLEIGVQVKDHRIQNVRVIRHVEKQFYASIKDVPARIVEKQGVKGIDATSGATITSEAIVNATSKALHDAAK